MDECATGGMFHEDLAKGQVISRGWGRMHTRGMRDTGRRSLALAAVWLGAAVVGPAGMGAAEGDSPDAADWWSLRSLSGKGPPPQARWARNEIDAFVLEELGRHGLEPSPEADRRTLIRRLSYDLIGLPPTPEEVERFVADGSPRAYEDLVERLLASPRHGERWARHWLDLVHYGETHGYDKDKKRPNAWPYRDYVIRSFNEDKPYARFVEEQVAGDELHPGHPDGIVALGFLAAGPWDFVGHVELREGTVDKEITRSNDRDDMVATVMSTFASTTAHCARCHDHKFDPIPQSDYYRLQAVVSGVDRADRPYDTDPARHALRRARERETGAGLEALPPPDGVVYAAAATFKPEGSFAPAGGPRAVRFLMRGDVKSPGDVMSPGALSVLPGLERHFRGIDARSERARRAALARWLTDPSNPLTWRSIVNRVWERHVGRGIVETSSDFGRMGALPTHPDLLDWLAARLRDGGGSLKDLHRLIVTSATYRQSSVSRPGAAEIDSENRRLWRMNRTRLDAECIRDSILHLSGRLDLRMGGPPDEEFAFKDDHSPVYDYVGYASAGPERRRRGIYRFIVRSVPDPWMDCLDAPDPSLLTPRRNTTLTALQALALLNSPFTVVEAEAFASRVRGMASGLDAQVDAAFRLALSRPPREEESKLLGSHAAAHGLESACRLIWNLNEFVFID